MAKKQKTYAQKRKQVLMIYRQALKRMGVPAFVVRELRSYGALKNFALVTSGRA